MTPVPGWIKRENSEPSYVELVADRDAWQAKCEATRRELREAQQDLSIVKDWMDAIAKAIERDFPSITKQTWWPCGLYQFPEAKNTWYFNPSLIRRQDGLFLVTRRSRDWPKEHVGRNDVYVWQLVDNKPVNPCEVKFPKRYADEHFEDPRTCWINEQLWLSCTNFQLNHDHFHGCHQIVASLDQNWRCRTIGDPVYGANGPTLYTQTGHEKNWLWFEHEKRFMMVYSAEPHVVTEWAGNLQLKTEHKSNRSMRLWQHGLIRGGTPPVRVGDEYWTFFHSSMPWIGKKRRYHMGAYAFEAKEPFAITRYTTLPLLSGSKIDPWNEGRPLVVFPCGALHEKNEWLVTLGVNDCACGWIRIPHNELLQLTRATEASNYEHIQAPLSA